MPLISFADIHPSAKSNLLLGNGLSIGVSDRFRYDSLLGVATRRGLISDADRLLFEAFDTTDFEQVLARLFIAHQVNSAQTVDARPAREAYDRIKYALIDSVRHIHPAHGSIAIPWLSKAADELKNHKRVFTTNYDALIYWIIGAAGFRGFTDVFFSGDLTFDPLDTEIWGKRTAVYYLHGALFLLNTPWGVRKIARSEDRSLFEVLAGELAEGNRPLFVSEGDTRQKLGVIKSHPYLTFALENLANMKGGVTIYGSSLGPSDAHLLSSLRKNRELKVAAVSLRTLGKEDVDLEREILAWENKFQGTLTLQFFPAEESPLSYAVHV
jgi:hypothetical protein